MIPQSNLFLKPPNPAITGSPGAGTSGGLMTGGSPPNGMPFDNGAVGTPMPGYNRRRYPFDWLSGVDLRRLLPPPRPTPPSPQVPAMQPPQMPSQVGTPAPFSWANLPPPILQLLMQRVAPNNPPTNLNG